jgi:hypothetical protein
MDRKKFLLPLMLIMLLMIMLGVTGLKNIKLQRELDNVIALNEVTLQELDTERIEHTSALKLLEDDDEYTDTLLQQITDLKSRPDKIKYVVRTETILQAGPIVTVKEIPDDYTFRLKNGLAVAAIDKQEESYDLLTYDLSLRGQVVVTANKANVSVQASSSEQPDTWVEVPVELRLIETEKKVQIEPHIGLGVAAGYPWHVSASLWTTVVHFPDGLDVGGAAILANDHSLQAGLIPIAYNIGDPLPVLTNVWVAPMVTIDLSGEPGGSILIGGKL